MRRCLLWGFCVLLMHCSLLWGFCVLLTRRCLLWGFCVLLTRRCLLWRFCVLLTLRCLLWRFCVLLTLRCLLWRFCVLLTCCLLWRFCVLLCPCFTTGFLGFAVFGTRQDKQSNRILPKSKHTQGTPAQSSHERTVTKSRNLPSQAYIPRDAMATPASHLENLGL